MYIQSRSPILVDRIDAIGYQTAIPREESKRVDSWQTMSGSQCNGRLRCDSVKMSRKTSSQPRGSRARDAITRSISASSRIGIAVSCMANDGATASTERRYEEEAGAVSGLNMMPTLVTWGAISLSNSSHLPPRENSKLANPVRLPPG